MENGRRRAAVFKLGSVVRFQAVHELGWVKICNFVFIYV